MYTKYISILYTIYTVYIQYTIYSSAIQHNTLCHIVVGGNTHLDVIITVVVQIENPVDFAVFAHMYVFGSLQALANGLSCIFFHLNVIELSVGDRKKNTAVYNWNTRRAPQNYDDVYCTRKD